ncbi:MAG: cupredoxin domain-containing protein [Deltaproteobacteria bacterium]|nr:cupredoxin domain-containing protein [Deltaproteobacteria bacterium]
MTPTVLLLLAALVEGASKAPAVPVRKIPVVAKKFTFTPSEIVVRKGQTVEVILTSADRVHGFELPELHVDVMVEPGKTTRVTLKPEKTGRFEFHCSVFCGSGHEEMVGALVVSE